MGAAKLDWYPRSLSRAGAIPRGVRSLWFARACLWSKPGQPRCCRRAPASHRCAEEQYLDPTRRQPCHVPRARSAPLWLPRPRAACRLPRPRQRPPRRTRPRERRALPPTVTLPARPGGSGAPPRTSSTRSRRGRPCRSARPPGPWWLPIASSGSWRRRSANGSEPEQVGATEDLRVCRLGRRVVSGVYEAHERLAQQHLARMAEHSLEGGIHACEVASRLRRGGQERGRKSALVPSGLRVRAALSCAPCSEADGVKRTSPEARHRAGYGETARRAWYRFGTGRIVHYVQIVQERGRIGRSGRSRTHRHPDRSAGGRKVASSNLSRPD